MDAVDAVAMGAMEAVSCTLVALPDAHNEPGIQTHDFSALFIPTASLKVHSTNTVSIDLSTLVMAIIIHLNSSTTSTGAIPDSLYSLLTNYEAHPSMRLSTTRAPIFDHRMQNPAFGYRSLGYFRSAIASSLQLCTIRPDSDLWEMRAWIDQLVVLDVRIDRHFILVLSDYGQPRTDHRPPSGQTSNLSDLTPYPPMQTGADSADTFFPMTDLFDFKFDDPALYNMIDRPQYGHSTVKHIIVSSTISYIESLTV
ncbi:hypothetical protein C8R46DRAFT_1306349 [Mycena filopes]|nr:hypothetical protein C8R46DRAFT_1306349 [Mycena filopes]